MTVDSEFDGERESETDAGKREREREITERMRTKTTTPRNNTHQPINCLGPSKLILSRAVGWQ